ncbi:MAG: twin-arginine translocase subunit TatC [Thiohalomonadales bacterium]
MSKTSKTSKTKEYPPLPEQPFVGHLIELRDRLLRAVVAILLVFLALFSFANDLYTALAEPLLRHMPQGTSMIATEVASPFLTPFKLTLVLSVFIAIPYLLYQAWGFIAPALYAKEKRLIFPLLFSSTLLFYTGMAFAYFVVFPLVFGFLTGVVPDGVEVMTDISRYLDFVLKLFFAFGIAFEVPIATILVIWAGLITREELAKKRPYIIVAAFVIGMLLTPPDVISQTLLALPMWLLFELGLIFSRFYRKPANEDAAEDLDAADDEADKDRSPTPQPASTVGSSNDVQHDDSPGSADHYSEAEEQTSELSEDDMEREFDRLEAEEDHADDWDDTTQQHEEFEPIEEERQRLAEQKAADEADKNDTAPKDSDEPPPSKT